MNISVYVDEDEVISELEQMGYKVVSPGNDVLFKIFEALQYRNDIEEVKRLVMDATGRIIS
jgi:hypothetical protein